jgi:hypothetical protein
MVRKWVGFQEAVTFRSLLLDYIDAAGGGLYWPLDAVYGVTDQSGNGHDGTAVGPTVGGHTATFAPIDGEDASCTDFDGTDDRITSVYGPYVNGTTRTILGWGYRDTSTVENCLFGSNGSGTRPYMRHQAGNQDIVFYSDDSASAAEFNTPAPWPGNGVWAFWALVFNETANQAELFVNGASTNGVKTLAAAYPATPGDFQVGAQHSSAVQEWDGKISHVAVVEGALTAQQIEDLYTASGN